MLDKKILDRCRIEPGEKFRIKDAETSCDEIDELKDLTEDALKKRAGEVLEKNLLDLSAAQDKLYADNRFSILVVFQAMDAAGKDGTIKHVMSGINPQGCQVFSFKKPSDEDLDHTFLWRCMKCLPERGRIGIFNRSYYEEVLVVKVHPELLEYQRLPPGKRGDGFWESRYDDINNFERHLVRNGTIVLKFFLNVSRKEQKRRFMRRLERPDKNWKFSKADLAERPFWKDYMSAYEDAINATSTKWAPWHVIPADQKWATRAIVADILTSAIQSLDVKYPELTEEQKSALAEAKRKLDDE